jgi:hypothetical protein
MEREQLQAWKRRWELVSARALEERKPTSPEDRLRHLDDLLEFAREMGWEERLAHGEAEVRSRWIELKRRAGV